MAKFLDFIQVLLWFFDFTDREFEKYIYTCNFVQMVTLPLPFFYSIKYKLSVELSSILEKMGQCFYNSSGFVRASAVQN